MSGSQKIGQGRYRNACQSSRAYHSADSRNIYDCRPVFADTATIRSVLMYILRLCCIAVITAVSALVLKSHKSELVPLCLTAGGILMFLFAFDYLTESVEFIKSFTEGAGIDNDIIRIIFKIIGIGFLVELTASSISDMGFNSIADKLVLCGKIIIFVVSIPILNATYKIIVSLINLV